VRASLTNAQRSSNGRRYSLCRSVVPPVVRPAAPILGLASCARRDGSTGSISSFGSVSPRRSLGSCLGRRRCTKRARLSGLDVARPGAVPEQHSWRLTANRGLSRPCEIARLAPMPTNRVAPRRLCTFRPPSIRLPRWMSRRTWTCACCHARGLAIDSVRSGPGMVLPTNWRNDLVGVLPGSTREREVIVAAGLKVRGSRQLKSHSYGRNRQLASGVGQLLSVPSDRIGRFRLES
jgi:hypothetical protein